MKVSDFYYMASLSRNYINFAHGLALAEVDVIASDVGRVIKAAADQLVSRVYTRRNIELRRNVLESKGTSRLRAKPLRHKSQV